MARERHRREISPPVEPQYTTVTTYTCDKCGKAISPFDHENDTAHELVISLDTYECVNFYRQRDYCPACLESIWAGINDLIGADPEVERDREYE